MLELRLVTVYLFIYVNKLCQEAGITHRASSSTRSGKTVYWYIGVFLGQNLPYTPLTLFLCIAGGDPESNGRQRHSKITATVGLVVHAAGKVIYYYY